jgi:hypothetical protein
MVARQTQLLAPGRVAERAAVSAGGRDSLLRVPGVIAAARDSLSPALDLGTLTLRFSVSRDEEYVELTARDDRRAIDLGARAHHLVLLALARSRHEDRKARAASPADLRAGFSEGWVYLDELAANLAVDEAYLNVAVFRSRRQLAQAGVLGAVRIVERRRLTREIRLGVARIEIETM